MTQNVVTRVLVIGNGFDLKCGLKSKFEDYYNSQDGMVKELNKMNSKFKDKNVDADILRSDVLNSAGLQRVMGNLNDNIKVDLNNINVSFWDFYFYFHKGSLNNWADVECFLNKLLVQSSNEIQLNLERALNMIAKFKYLYSGLSIDNSFSTKTDELIEKFTEDKETLILLFVILHNLKYDIEKHSQMYFYDFLRNELNKFEISFRSYLEAIQGEEYKEKSQQLLKELAHDECYNLLNFNYTSPCTTDSSCNITRNIHGKLEDHPIIGIDSRNIDASSPVFRFTKTYRIMTLSGEKQDKLLPKTVKTLAFYGHSLAQADYSYFQSIFDYYNIYDNDITLVFYYSIYDHSREQEIKQEQFNSVSKLISKYGATFHNEKGENLTHKMLLEGRLLLINLDQATNAGVELR